MRNDPLTTHLNNFSTQLTIHAFIRDVNFVKNSLVDYVWGTLIMHLQVFKV